MADSAVITANIVDGASVTASVVEGTAITANVSNTTASVTANVISGGTGGSGGGGGAVDSVNGETGVVVLDKSDIGLGNVDNTSDANKPISTLTQTALDAKQPLDSDLTALAAIAPSNDDIIQRKSGAWTNRTPSQVKTDLALTKSDVGLSNVDNTSDAGKPISTATQTALDLKAPLASPTFTGTPAAPTATAGTNTTQIATTAYVRTAIDNVVNAAPGALDTLNELAAALGNDASFATTVTTALGTKANDSAVVHKTGTETIAGAKTFTSDTVLADNATPTKAYRLKSSGSNLDFDAGGTDMFLSVYANADFTGTQYNKIRMVKDATARLIGTWQFTDAPYGTTFASVDGATGIGTFASVSANFFSQALATKTANYTLTATDSVILGDTTSGSVTLTLPTAVGLSGRCYTLKKLVAANTLNIATTSSQTIDGSTSLAITRQYESITVISNGANWSVI